MSSRRIFEQIKEFTLSLFTFFVFANCAKYIAGKGYIISYFILHIPALQFANMGYVIAALVLGFIGYTIYKLLKPDGTGRTVKKYVLWLSLLILILILFLFIKFQIFINS